MDTISFEHLTFSYPLSEEAAVRDISFSVRPSDFIVIAGKSGCGKTTLLRHMKKNLIPYGRREGRVLYEGIQLEELDDRKSAAEIGYVQQDPDNQIVTDKVWHELAFGLESLGISSHAIRRRVAEMASYFDIQTWFRKDVSQLSGGQKQLLNLASIMAMQPRLLVLDEPTSQLDPIAAEEFLRTLYKINRDLGTTVILSEHRLEDAFTMADRVMILDQGEIIAYDEPRVIGRFLSGGDPKCSRSNSEVNDTDQTRDARHPMFYGLPSVIKIYEAAGGKEKSPLTIREGRMWVQDTMQRKGIQPRIDDTVWNAGARQEEPEYKVTDPAVSLKGLWFRYDKRSGDVLRDLTLEVPKGKLFCILGGNGCGKSTLLKNISGILRPQRGKISVDGRLAMLPQNPQSLFTEISVEDELLEALHGAKKTDEEKAEAVLSMLKMMEIGHLRKSHPYDLSGGEQQRLALGKVLLLEPEVILLDEATKGLDPFFKITLAGILKKLTDEGRTLLMVSHDIEFCAEFADRCALFFDGGIVSQGSPKEFFPGNNFYTTTSNRIARDYFPEAITWEEVAACIAET